VINSPAEVEKFSDLKVHAGDFTTMAFHPMGTCRMGANKKKSVVDLNLETWQLRNLFIADASVFPTSLGVNPQETIWAFATKCAEHISKNVL
jgi:choline dehydrogenase-like flavoprotein